MNEILQKLNKKFDDKYSFLKLYEVLFDKNSNLCTFTFLFPFSREDLQPQDRKEIEQFIKDTFSFNCDVKVKFKKSFLDEVLIRREIGQFFKFEKQSVAPYIFDENIIVTQNNYDIAVQIKINQDVLSMLDEQELKTGLIKYLSEKFIANFSLVFLANEDSLPQQIDAPDLEPTASNKVERYQVEILKKIVGSPITPKPEYIKNNNKPKQSVILFGNISNIAKKTFTIKKGKHAGQEKSLYTFILDDGAKIECVYFCSKTNEKVMDSLENNMTVLCVGDLNYGLNGNLTYYVRKMSWAHLKEVQQAQREEDYQHKQVVFPEKIEIEEQSSLFEKKIDYNDTVRGKTIVVFDIETTGLDSENDEITEIGAVKVVDGVICERFASFVKPSISIPQEVQQLTHITNEMVKDAPSIKDVIYDFYDFCTGCLLCGHNAIGFDFKFIKKAAEKAGLHFKNQIIDTLILARTSSLRLANYKLGTIVSALGLTLEGAHRAYNDAFATAQVLLGLCKIKK